jgi:hypothetical protein
VGIIGQNLNASSFLFPECEISAPLTWKHLADDRYSIPFSTTTGRGLASIGSESQAQAKSFKVASEWASWSNDSSKSGQDWS